MANHNNESVLCGMVMNIDDLDTTLKSILQEVQWTQFLCMCEPVYYSRVREFWNNAFNFNGNIASLVDGTFINVTPMDLSRVTGYQSDGILFTNNWYDSYTNEEISSSLTYTNDHEEIIWHDQITTTARFLHHIVADFVCPRTRFGYRDRVSNEEKFILFHTLRRVKVDHIAFILRYMMSVIRGNQTELVISSYQKIFSYGMLLSKIFMSVNINLATQVYDRECGPAIIFDYDLDDIYYSRLMDGEDDSDLFLEMLKNKIIP